MLALVLTSSRALAQGRERNPGQSSAGGPTWPLPHEGTKRLNRATHRWLSAGGEFRLRWEGRENADFRSNTEDTSLLTRFRVHLDFHPEEWFRTYIEGQDAQAIGLAADPDPPPFEDTFDLRQAYIDVFHRHHKGLGLRVGRQELIFGEERLIGASDWTNTARTFDAVRLYYENKAVCLDAFAASVVRIEEGRFNRRTAGDHLYGVHATFLKAIPQGRWDAYTFWRAQSQVRSEGGKAGNADRITFGARFVGTLRRRFDYGVELVGQVGDVAGDDVRAWASHLQLGYTPVKVPGNPRFLAEYNFASGDDTPTDGKIGTFDQLFPSNHNKYGIADLMGWRNMHNLRLGLSLSPVERMSVSLDAHSFWLASRRDALYDASGRSVGRILEGAASRHVGQEIDVYGSIGLADSFSLGAGWAYLFAGHSLKQATSGHNPRFTYATLTYRF